MIMSLILLFETNLKRSDGLSRTREETIWNPHFIKNYYGFLEMDNRRREGSGKFEADVLTKGKGSFRKPRICPIVATGGWL